MSTQAVSRDLRIGQPQQWIVDPRIDRDGPLVRFAAIVGVEFRSLPGGSSVRKALRVGGGRVSLSAQQTGGLVLTVPVALVALPANKNHVRPHLSHDSHEVAQDFLSRPVPQGLVQRFGVPEVGETGEPQPCAVVLGGSLKLERPQHAQPVERIVCDQIGPGFPAGDRRNRHVDAESAAEVGQRARVLIIRVSGDVQHAVRIGEPPQVLPQAGLAAIDRQGLGGASRQRQAQKQRDGAEEATHTAQPTPNSRVRARGAGNP